MLLGLLVVALACLVIGLIQAQAVWFIASLLASIGAGYLLWRARAPREGGGVEADAADARSADDGTDDADDDYDDQDATLAAAVATGTGTAGGASVVAGSGRSAAVSGSGGRPAGGSAAASAGTPGKAAVPATTPTGADIDVWVIDGRPRYHRSDCGIINGQLAEPIPLGQATEDGFMPCTQCEPEVLTSH